MITVSEIRNAKILIVDDSAANVMLLEHLLKSSGYTAVSSTKDSREVLELYRAHRYDLILLDLNMPNIDGFQVMEALQEIETEGYLPVLVITAEAGHRARALAAGAKDFVGKPVDPVEALNRIHNMLETRLLRKRLSAAEK
jgi:CheY-like chemotaxis protein